MPTERVYHYPVYTIPADKWLLDDDTRTTVVVEKDHLGNAEMDLLEKIMAAMKCDLASESIVTLDGEKELRLSGTPDFKTDRVVLLFGVDPRRLGLQVSRRLYKPFHLGSWTLINCQSLTELLSDVRGKKALWAIIKKYFLT